MSQNRERTFINPDIVFAAQNGDAQAAGQLFLELIKPTQKLFRKDARNIDTAEELAIDSVNTIIAKLHKYSPRPNVRFESWAYTVVRNELRDHLRSNRVRERKEWEYYGRASGNEKETAESVEEKITYEEQKQTIINIIHDEQSKVPFRQHQVLEMSLNGLNSSQIASLTGVSKDAVKKLLRRGKNRIKKIISKKNGKESTQVKPEREKAVKVNKKASLLSNRAFRIWLMNADIATCREPQLLEDLEENPKPEVIEDVLKRAGWKSGMTFLDLSVLAKIPDYKTDQPGTTLLDLSDGFGARVNATRMHLARLERKLPPGVSIRREHLGVMQIWKVTEPKQNSVGTEGIEPPTFAV